LSSINPLSDDRAHLSTTAIMSAHDIHSGSESEDDDFNPQPEIDDDEAAGYNQVNARRESSQPEMKEDDDEEESEQAAASRRTVADDEDEDENDVEEDEEDDEEDEDEVVVRSTPFRETPSGLILFRGDLASVESGMRVCSSSMSRPRSTRRKRKTRRRTISPTKYIPTTFSKPRAPILTTGDIASSIGSAKPKPIWMQSKLQPDSIRSIGIRQKRDVDNRQSAPRRLPFLPLKILLSGV
jgi:hypothetical protein